MFFRQIGRQKLRCTIKQYATMDIIQNIQVEDRIYLQTIIRTYVFVVHPASYAGGLHDKQVFGARSPVYISTQCVR